MKYRIIISAILVLILAFAAAVHSESPSDVQQPTSTAAPTFN